MNHSTLLPWIFAGGRTLLSLPFPWCAPRTHPQSVPNSQKLIFIIAGLWSMCMSPPALCDFFVLVFASLTAHEHFQFPVVGPSSREAHFLILELPESQRVTGPGCPTRAWQTQPSSCLQEVDGKPFVFGFYKRKFCRGLPERDYEADTRTRTYTQKTNIKKQKHIYYVSGCTLTSSAHLLQAPH